MTEDSKSYDKELNKELLFKYASNGNLIKIKNLIEGKGVNINTTKYNITALSVCAAKSGDTKVMEYLLSRGAEIRDSLLYAIKAGNIENVELLLSRLPKADEMRPIKDSSIFAPYMTPLMLAAICGHRTLIELLMIRGHTIPLPHLAHCECDDCNVSSTEVSTPSQRNLDIYRALCNPEYIGLNSSDPIKKAFELEEECLSVIKNSSYFSHHYNDLFRKMEKYVKDIIDVTRDAEEVKVLIKQRSDTTQRNVFLKYLVLQKAVDHNWLEFIASKRIESLRSHLWLGHNKMWFQTGIIGLSKRFAISLLLILGQLIMGIALVVRYRKHNSAQTRYLCRMFNESMFAFALLYFLNTNPINKSSQQLLIRVLIIVWTSGNIINIMKKWAIFGLKKLWRFYGHLFEFFITIKLLVIIYLNFLCDKSNKNDQKSDEMNGTALNDWMNGSELDRSVCIELKYVILRILVKVIHVRLVILASLRAYKGSEEQPVIRLFLLSFSLISLFYPLFADTITTHYNLSSFEGTLGLKMFGNWDPTYVLIAINFLIGLSFEITSGPEKISDKIWCFHWTARLIYEIHGACELAVPFNILETHKVLYLWLKRVGFKEKVKEEDIRQYNRIKGLVYSRYECIKYLESKSGLRIDSETN